jgi:hypothetical protein
MMDLSAFVFFLLQKYETLMMTQAGRLLEAKPVIYTLLHNMSITLSYDFIC